MCLHHIVHVLVLAWLSLKRRRKGGKRNKTKHCTTIIWLHALPNLSWAFLRLERASLKSNLELHAFKQQTFLKCQIWIKTTTTTKKSLTNVNVRIQKPTRTLPVRPSRRSSSFLPSLKSVNMSLMGVFPVWKHHNFCIRFIIRLD